jgi:hypothetical protein
MERMRVAKESSHSEDKEGEDILQARLGRS